jgi:hypothetical protein
VELIENGPLRAMLYIKCADIGDTTADTWIIFTGEDQIDFGNVVNKPETTAKEAGYFAFPIRLDAPDKTRTLLELPYGIVEADKEQLPGADREWYSTNSFIGVTDSQCTALIATPHAPMVTVGNINRGLWPDKVDNNRGTVFAYVFNNYWHTNYKASQGGPLMFGFSLKFSPGDFDPVAATKFGWEQVANINGPIYSPPGLTSLTDLPAKPEGSLLHLDGNVVLGGLSRHDGALLARLYNPTSAPQDATLALTGRRIMGAAQTDLFGANGKAVSEPMPAKALKVTVPARGLMTLKLETKAM